MRKRTIKNIASTVFWYILYFLPIISYLLFLVAEPAIGTEIIPLNSFLTTSGFSFLTDNLIYSTLIETFGSTGIFPLFTDYSIFVILTWFVSVFIVHLVVDFLLFIPKLAHKWMRDCTED